MATLEPKFKMVGPYAPKDFANLTTLTAAIETDVGTLTGISTVSLIASDPIQVLGNWYILVTYC
tara:strand:- start:997 stop:1188 length:192 start_codon:yes stop_codon:yes gene_type:complete